MTQEAKAALRARLIAARRALAPSQRADASFAIAGRVAALPAFARARRVALYAPMGAEVDTSELARLTVEAGKEIAWPRMVPDVPPGTRRMDFASCDFRQLEPGPGSIRQPPPAAPAVSLASIDLACVPGVGFDLGLHRLGRGGGNYDSVLTATPGSAARGLVVGLAFDVQVVPALPVEPHDAPVDLVVTESRIIEPGAGRRG